MMNYATQIDPNLRHPEESENPEPFWFSEEQRLDAEIKYLGVSVSIYRPKPVTVDDVQF